MAKKRNPDATLIPIDRHTFRNNPDAGRTEWAVPGLTQVTFSRHADGVTSDYVSTGPVTIEADAVSGTAICTRTERRTHRDLTWGFPDGTPVPFKMAMGDKFRLERSVEHFRTMSPAPDWLYKYVPTFVQCSFCGAQFLHTKLERDEVPDGDGGEHSIDDICPHCGESDCCELEWEKPDAVARELGLDR